MTQTWLSYHFYPLETPDVFLTRALRPFLEQYIWPTKGARAFFVRYDDERGPHIRLRLRGEAEWVEDTLRPAVEGLPAEASEMEGLPAETSAKAGWFRERGERIEVPYQPEPERFGGEEPLAWAEEHFHVSTRVVLDRLNQATYTYGDAMFDGLRTSAIAAYAAGFDRERTAWYFGQLCEQWMPLFFRPEGGAAADAAFFAAIKEKFEASFERQKDDLRDTLAGFWKTLETGKFDEKQPEWLRWLRGNELILKGLDENLDRALPSLLHLNYNRLGVTNQDEVFLCYLLSRAI